MRQFLSLKSKSTLTNSFKDVLLRLQLDRRSLVIDSPCPDLAPHIVITPPDVDDAWDLYWAAWSNRIGIQDSQFLLVPTLDESPSPLASLPPHPDLELRHSRAECLTVH